MPRKQFFMPEFHVGRQFLIPGFVDCHIHSPQLPIQAVGTDLGLLAWLKKYTFPTEMKFESEDFAAQAHEKTVVRMVFTFCTDFLPRLV